MILYPEQLIRLHNRISLVYGMTGGIYCEFFGEKEVERLYTVLEESFKNIESNKTQRDGLSLIKKCLQNLVEDIEFVEKKIATNLGENLKG